ncbi:MAG: CDP-diacylglycerol--serine O-phosphatidyltransferase [Desulfovibrio sp.]|jgi:CDP-diacylglycerol--serine O-phosphatidyltransferase|nr:CDP-diacylglycerol--serine O-phosphatidyltransferase [Desulfovibrio sp.]
MEGSLPRNKSVYILPNLFTTASLLAGFLGILWAAAGSYESCAYAVLFSAIMDGLDGKVARLTGTSSEFGVQYDSLADLIAFGLAPSFLIFQYTLKNFNGMGTAACFLFTVCAALRLARFNISTSTANKKFFTGLPTPAAGCALACIILIDSGLPELFHSGISGFSLFCAIAIALLMVSRIRYASFKELGFLKAHPFRTMIPAIVIFALVVANPKVFISIILFGYILSGLVYTFITLPKMAKLANRISRHTEKHGDHPS